MALAKADIDKITQAGQTPTPHPGRKAPESLIHSFIQKCNEDGGYSMADLQKLALLLDIAPVNRINSEVELIRAIQKASENRPCFRSNLRKQCQEAACPWKSECKKIIAEWLR